MNLQGDALKKLKARYECPVELALEFVGGKWKTVILALLKESPLRYSELRARIPLIADKILTESLKDLEALELVEKTPLVEGAAILVYRLTERGQSLRPILDALYAWGKNISATLPVTIKGISPC